MGIKYFVHLVKRIHLMLVQITLCHSAINASREAPAKPSKSNLMLYSVQITRTEQSPTLFGHTYTQACGRQEVQWKEQGIENPRVGGSIPPPKTTFQNNINDLISEHLRYTCEFQRHTKHTLFRVFLGRDSGVRHCVGNIVKEHSH